MTEEEQQEVRLYAKYIKSKEKNILDEYSEQPLENVPEEYREKIAKLREFGLGKKDKTTYEEVIEFLETHNGKLMQGSFRENGKQLTVSELTQEQQEERNLYSRWRNSRERDILAEYAGQPIENVPEEHREKIARLREYGLGTIKGKLSQAKQQRDEAKTRNSQAKELEQQVDLQLKRKGKSHE